MNRLYRTVLASSSSSEFFFVRPAGSSYGTGDGTSYENAWSGFGAVDQAAVVAAGKKLAICGEHRETFTITNNNLYVVGNFPTEAGWINGQNSRPTGITIDGLSDITIEGLSITHHSAQNIFLGNGSDTGSFYNITTIDCVCSHSGNQGIQHWGIAGSTATHYNLTANNNGDEGISGHQDCTITVYGGQFRNNVNAFVNTVGSVQVNVHNVWDTNANGRDLQIGRTIAYPQNSVCNVFNSRITNFTSTAWGEINFTNTYVSRVATTTGADDIQGAVRFNRCFIDASTITGAAQGFMDLQSTARLSAQYTVFRGAVGTVMYILQRSGSVVENLSNCNFIGVGDAGQALFRSNSFTVRNCIFRGLRTINSGPGGTTTFRHCSFTNNTGSPVGTIVSSVNSNPLFVNEAGLDFRLQSGSPMIGAGETHAGFETGISTANWGNSTTVPVVTTKTQNIPWDIGAFIS